MHKRDITQEQFEATVAQLADARRYACGHEIVAGQHAQHGATVLVRRDNVCVMLVDDDRPCEPLVGVGNMPGLQSHAPAV